MGSVTSIASGHGFTAREKAPSRSRGVGHADETRDSRLLAPQPGAPTMQLKMRRPGSLLLGERAVKVAAARARLRGHGCEGTAARARLRGHGWQEYPGCHRLAEPHSAASLRTCSPRCPMPCPTPHEERCLKIRAGRKSVRSTRTRWTARGDCAFLFAGELDSFAA